MGTGDRRNVAVTVPCGRTAMVAVETAAGPHVTPQAFAAAGGHAWLVVPSRSAKVRAIRKRPQVALLFNAGDRSLVASGRAEVLGPIDVARLGPLFAMAGIDYLFRNSALVAGIGTDVLVGAAAPPTNRVLIRITTDEHRHLGDGPLDLEVVVSGARPELERPVDDAALGLATADGPVVVPVEWDPDDGTARVRSRDLAAVGAVGDTPACLTLASSPGTRPSSFAGVLLRGVLRRTGDSARLAVRTRSWWDGYDTGSDRG